MKEQVLAIIHDLCLKEAYEQTSAMQLSEALRMSRNQCAVMLNQLVKEKKVVKVGANPKLFLSTEVLKEKHGISCLEDTYPSLAQVFSIKEEHHDFEKLIGYDQSLKETVKQCKATISYPPHGLPMMLYGPTGTGKSYIAKLTYEWAVNHGVIRADAKFITVNCSEYANNPELLTANLFGHVKGAFTGADKDNEGLISLADQGILFLDEVHELKAECQEKLFLVMDQGIYHRVGDNEKWYKSQTRIIFATTENPEHVLLKTLLRRIPMTITVPSLEERGMQERIELLYDLFSKEEERLHCSIKISNKVYTALLCANLSGNIGELKSVVQSCCINSLFHRENDTILINLDSLPKTILDEVYTKQSSMQESNDYILVKSLQSFYHTEKEIIQLNQNILAKYQSYLEHELTLQELMEDGKKLVSTYFDRLMFEKKTNSQHEFYRRGVQHIFNLIESQYGFTITNNEMIAIACYLNEIHQDSNDFWCWSLQHEDECEDLYQVLQDEFYRPTKIALEICTYLKSYLDLEVHPIMIVTFLFYVYHFHRNKRLNQKACVILAHGFSTASSIADAANRLLNDYIFDAIDMSIYIDTNTIVDKLNMYLARIGKVKEIYLLVDMGSLEEIYHGLQVENADIGIINNISTSIALEIGAGLRQNIAMEDLLKSVIEHTNYTYHIIQHKQKRPAILCSCASGIGTAYKIKEMIEEAFPEGVSIEAVTQNYSELVKYGLENPLFEQYNVLCVIGTLDPNIPKMKFIGVEDLILETSSTTFEDYFHDFMTQQQAEEFSKNILKNFSLSNLMNALTILNPNKLLEQVANAIDLLQTNLGVAFTNKTCFGLYVHVCCLIERLIVSKGTAEYPDCEDFVLEHEEFIQYVRRAFQMVEEFYGVFIPDEEIRYIYHYVSHDH